MIQTRPLFDFVAHVGEPQVTPDGPYGIRRFIPITGGTFHGARLSGHLLPGGADCQLIRPDGVAELDVKATFQVDDGTIFLMRGLGMRHGPQEVLDRIAAGDAVDPATYYFRETMIFEAPAGPHDWLNRIIAVATGERRAATVHINAHELL